MKKVEIVTNMLKSSLQPKVKHSQKYSGLLAYGISLTLLLSGMSMLLFENFRQTILSAITVVIGISPATFWSDKLQWLGLESIIGGILFGVLGYGILKKEFNTAWLKERKHLFTFVFSLLLISLWLPIILCAHNATIAGETYWWLGDDAMISMRYAHNLADGEGLVWNAGERVEGYSNFLWTLYMAVIHLLPISLAKTSLIILLTNLILAVATLFVIERLVKLLHGDYLVLFGVLLACVLSQNLMFWTTAGFETALLTFLFLLSIYRIMAESQKGEPRLSTFFIIGLIALVRADSVVFTGLSLGVALLLHSKRWKVIAYSSVALLIPVAHIIFRISYYGELLPNTAYLKTLNWDGKYIAGLIYVFSFTKTYTIPIILGLTGAILTKNWKQRALFGMIILYLLYVAYIGGDVFPNYRFLTPVIPLLMILAFLGINRLFDNTNLRLLFTVLCIAMIPLIIPGYSASLYPNTADEGNVKIGLLIKTNTPEDAKIADFWAGSVFYFSERYAIDLLGKSDKFIARNVSASEGMLPGHNKFDFGYSLGNHQPDFIISNFKLPVDEETMLVNASGNYGFTGQLYFNELFRKHYLSHPVPEKTWRTIFAYDESPLANEIGNWIIDSN